MSTPAPNEGFSYSQPQRAASRIDATLRAMSEHIAVNLSPADLNELGRAIVQAQHAVGPDSVASAAKNEDASHILARINLVDAKANALLVASDYLCHLAHDLLRQVNELRDAVEPTDDSDL